MLSAFALKRNPGSFVSGGFCFASCCFSVLGVGGGGGGCSCFLPAGGEQYKCLFTKTQRGRYLGIKTYCMFLGGGDSSVVRAPDS